MEFGFGFGVLGEEIPGPGEGVGYGLVAGEEDGEDFVADLVVGHVLGCVCRWRSASVGFVGAGEEHGEEVAFVGFAVGGGFAVLADEAVDYGVEAGFGSAEFGEAGDGEVEEVFEAGEGDDEVVEAHDGVDFVVDGADVGGDFGVEEGAGYDLERERHAGGGDVDGLAGLPVVAVGGGDGDDLVGVGGDALAMEGGRGDAALADVDGIFGGDEAFAEEDLHAADGALFDEAVGVVDEDFSDVVGVVDEDDGRAHEAVVGDVAVGLEEVLEEADGVAEFDPGLEGVEGKRVAQAGGILRDLGGDAVDVRSGGGSCFQSGCCEAWCSAVVGDSLRRRCWRDDLCGFASMVPSSSDGDDAVGFAGGDLFVVGVDAAVEVVGLALEAVLVGALLSGRCAGCGGGRGGGRLRGAGAGGG